MFKGSITALITPFKNGAVDEDRLQSYVEWQIEEGTNGLVPVGTTGESPTLSHEEHKRVVELCVEVANKRVPVIAGAGSNSTDEALELARHAEAAGADGVLIVTPYYNKPTQDGLIGHYKAIAEAVDLPIIIYNIPPRSVVDMSVETMARLAEDCPNIVGVKDATNDLARPGLQRMACGKDFIQLSGEDPTAIGYNAQGGVGCISVTANAAPRMCAEMQAACLNNDFDTALSYQDRLMPLHRALFLESNPAPVKYAVSLLGRCEPNVRLPLVETGDATRTAVREAMVHAGLLNA